MNRAIRLLALLTAVQIALVVLTHVGNQPLAAGPTQEALLVFDPVQVDTVLIQGEDGNKQSSVTLSKHDDRWQLPDGFPVDKGKLEQLVNKLQTLKHALSVTTSKAALKRFKVEETDYERRISLRAGDKVVADLYLGKGAGARQAYARSAGSNVVYSVALASYDAPLKAQDWQDKNVLQVKKSTVSALDIDGLHLQRNLVAHGEGKGAGNWNADTLPDGKQVNQQAVADLLNKLSSLRFSKVLGSQEQSAYGLDQPAGIVDVVSEGKHRKYRFGAFNENYVVKIPDRAEYFEVAKYVAQPLLDALSVDKLVMAVPAVESTADTMAPAAEAPATLHEQAGATAAHRDG